MNNSEQVQNRSLGHISIIMQIGLSQLMWICLQQHIYEIYEEISNIKAFSIEESECYNIFHGGHLRGYQGIQGKAREIFLIKKSN